MCLFRASIFKIVEIKINTLAKSGFSELITRADQVKCYKRKYYAIFTAWVKWLVSFWPLFPHEFGLMKLIFSCVPRSCPMAERNKWHSIKLTSNKRNDCNRIGPVSSGGHQPLRQQFNYLQFSSLGPFVPPRIIKFAKFNWSI